MRDCLFHDSYGNKTSVTDPNGHITLFEYQELAAYGLPKYVKVDPLNGTGVQTTTTEYDLSTSLVKKQTDPNDNYTEINYTNQLTGLPDPFGRAGITYSPAVTVNGVSQRRKAVTTYEDRLPEGGSRITVTADLNTEGDGLLKSRTTADELGRTKLVEQSEDGSTYTISARTEYEQGGRFIYQSNPRRSTAESTDGWTRATKDVMGRVIEVATFSGTAQPPATGTNANWTGSVTSSYSANFTTVTDQAEKARKSEVDGLGRLVKVIEDPQTGGMNYETSYTYDVLGNLTGVTQGTQTRSFTYSSLSRLTSAQNPESGTIEYQYDANGNLVLKLDPRTRSGSGSLPNCSIPYTETKTATCYKYDSLNRLKTRKYNDGTPDVTYTYDTLTNGKGRLTSVSSTVSTTSYAGYDSLGRVTGSTQVTDGHTYQMPEYKYNLAGGLTSEQYPSGRIVSTGYDDAGRLSSITGQKSGEANKTYASSISYTAHGGIGSMKLGNELWEHTLFNSRLQPIEIGLGASSTASGTLQLNYSYGVRVNNTLDGTKNNGNVESQTIAGAGLNLTQSYSYDALNRIKTFSETEGSSQTVGLAQTYDYDRWGNRAVTAGYVQSGTLTPTVQSLSGVNGFNSANNRIANAIYDNAGNLTSAVAGHQFNYDAENRMTSHDDASTVGTLDDQYSYDGDGRRVKKVHLTVTTLYVYDAMGQMVAEYTDDSNPSPTSGTSYFTSDHLGTPRVITNQQQAVISRHDYLPFGEELGAGTGGRTTSQGYSQVDNISQKFSQKERDAETGLDYFGARYFASTQGRFTSADPLGPWAMSEDEKANFLTNPQKWSRYAYVINNPGRYTDPKGLELYDNVSEEDQERIHNALVEISKTGNSEQRRRAKFILKNDVVISVESDVSGEGATRIADPDAANAAISRGYVSMNEAASYIRMRFNPSILANTDGAKAMLEETLVHEGKHVYDNARTISSLSADAGPNVVYNPTKYRGEFEAFRTGASYLLRRGNVYVQVGLDIGFLKQESGKIKVNEERIRQIITSNYGGITESEQGPTTTQRYGLHPPQR